jgi:2-polyprenyl-6-methoxyphenol hydroxylase-like FAD-dependent oxidoreductase
MRIAIAGGGIGGLAAALALSNEGHDVCVYEAAPELLPLGVGINLLPHASRILAGYGVVEKLLKSGVETRELVYHNRHGQRIWAEPRGKFAGFDAPQISLSRGALHFGLLAAVEDRIGKERVIRDRRLTAFAETGDRIDIQFSDLSGGAHAASADLLICADGIHSAARASLYPNEGKPIYSGRTLWRATSFAKPYLTGATMIMAGHQDQKFVCYPIEPVRADGLQRINWIAELRIDEFRRREDWNREGRLEDFYPRFKSWTFDWLDVPALIESAEKVYEYPMVDRDPLPRWSHGRMTLLGDAGHPMYPIGSNGASQAILDVDALVRALHIHADPVLALAAYEAERLPATAAIVRANRQNGPEHCMQLSEERAPNGFDRIEDVFAPGELQAMADKYKVLTGMKKAPVEAKLEARP